MPNASTQREVLNANVLKAMKGMDSFAKVIGIILYYGITFFLIFIVYNNY